MSRGEFFLQGCKESLGSFGKNLIFLPGNGGFGENSRFQGAGAEAGAGGVDEPVEGQGIAHALLDHQGSIVDQGVGTCDFQLGQGLFQPAAQLIAMRAG